MKYKSQPLIRRVGFALAGVRAAWAEEPSFRTQVVIALALIPVLAVLRPDPLWWAVAGLTAVGVLAAELLNSAVERLADVVSPKTDPRLGEAKDLAAGGVFFAAFGALWVGALLIVTLLDRGME
jgi:diacylglycerol kinase (ATP)